MDSDPRAPELAPHQPEMLLLGAVAAQVRSSLALHSVFSSSSSSSHTPCSVSITLVRTGAYFVLGLLSYSDLPYSSSQRVGFVCRGSVKVIHIFSSQIINALTVVSF